MRLFLKKLILFSLLPLTYFGINLFINVYLYSNQETKTAGKNILIVGDSHPQNSLNPKFFTSAENISMAAEPLVITYWKVEKVFQSNLPDTLILGIAPHNISQMNDYKFYEKEWASEMFKRSYTFQKLDDIEDSIPFDYLTYYKVLWKETVFFPKANHIQYIGKYFDTYSNDISKCEESSQKHYYYNKMRMNISKISIKYLDSIVQICKKNDITLILVSHPIHECYLKSIPKPIMNRYNDLLNHYSESIVVYDKTKERYPDSLYFNADHLNHLGAARFTKEVVSFLNQ